MVTATLSSRAERRAGPWLAVGGASLAVFTVFGVAYSFGAFFSAMREELGSGAGSTALLFGIANFVCYTGGLITGRIADRTGPRPLALVGAASLAGGLALTSVINSVWLGYLTYGVGVGVAVACTYVPMVAMVSSLFTSRRATALGLTVAGIGLGNLVATYVSAELIDAHGWRHTYRIYAVVGALLLLGAAACTQRPAAGGPVVAPGEAWRRAVRLPAFRTLYLSMAVLCQGLFVPFVFLPAYARDHGIESGPAALLVGIVGGASIGGRLILGGLGGRVGVVRLYQASFAMMAGAFLIWLAAADSYAVLVSFAVAFGASYGGFVALAPAVAAEVFGTAGLGTVLGVLYTAPALGGIGLYLFGELIDTTGSYGGSIKGSAGLLALSLVLLAPLSRSRRENPRST